MALPRAARDVDWSACTIRGWADGSLVFKFDSLDPVAEDEPRGAAAAVTWRAAKKLGVKFPQHVISAVDRLEQYVELYGSRDGVTPALQRGMQNSIFRPFDKPPCRRAAASPEDREAAAALAKQAADEHSVSCAEKKAEAELAAATAAAAAAAAAMRAAPEPDAPAEAVPRASWLGSLAEAAARALPFRLRRLVAGEGAWPPVVGAAHVSPSLAALLADRAAIGRASMDEAGFNPQGERLPRPAAGQHCCTLPSVAAARRSADLPAPVIASVLGSWRSPSLVCAPCTTSPAGA
jgi:hypothetical protein